MGTKKYAKTDGRAVQMKHYSWERKKKLNSGEKSQIVLSLDKGNSITLFMIFNLHSRIKINIVN